jgi:uncharacterized protein YndB with AHSA1/START domain
MTTKAADPATRREVHITRVIAAPRELVFRAWTDPAQLPLWYAPHGCTVRFSKLDLRPGGEFLCCIRSPAGHECWCKGTYREIAAPERIVHTMEIADAQGRSITALEAGMDPEWPQQTLLAVTFEELEPGETRLTLRQTVLESLAKRTGAHPSWLEMLDRLAAHLVTQH